MSQQTKALDAHLDEHGCGNPESPNYTSGWWHCEQARQLYEAIPPGDPDCPVIFG